MIRRTETKCKICSLALMKGEAVRNKCSGCEIFERVKEIVGEGYLDEFALIEGILTIGGPE